MSEEQSGLMEAGLQSSKLTIVEDTTTQADGVAVIQLYDPPSCLRCTHLLSLTDECIEGLRKLLLDETVMPMIKVGISLLLRERDTFNHWKGLCRDDVENMKRYPIWKFYSDLS
jgi:hypothetical protein